MIRGLKDALPATEGEEAPEDVSNLARLLYDAALLESGYVPDDPKAFSSRVHVSGGHT